MEWKKNTSAAETSAVSSDITTSSGSTGREKCRMKANNPLGGVPRLSSG